jgi:hypothetical protein
MERQDRLGWFHVVNVVRLAHVVPHLNLYVVRGRRS